MIFFFYVIGKCTIQLVPNNTDGDGDFIETALVAMDDTWAGIPDIMLRMLFSNAVVGFFNTPEEELLCDSVQNRTQTFVVSFWCCCSFIFHF